MDPECYWPVLLSMNFRNLRYCSFCLKNLKNIEGIYAQRPMKQSLLVSAQWFIKIRTQEVSPTCLIHFPSFSHPVLQCSCLQGAEQDTTCRPSEERTCWDCGDISMRLLSYSVHLFLYSFFTSFHCLFFSGDGRRFGSSTKRFEVLMANKLTSDCVGLEEVSIRSWNSSDWNICRG